MRRVTNTGDERIESALCSAGIRYNRARRQVVDRLRAEGRPMSAEELRGVEASIPYSSLYRNLAVLSRAGVLHRIAGPDGVTHFELAEAFSGNHHHHLLCEDCGTMTVIVLAAKTERSLAAAAGEAMKASGFTVRTHRVELVGRCRNCVSRAARQDGTGT